MRSMAAASASAGWPTKTAPQVTVVFGTTGDEETFLLIDGHMSIGSAQFLMGSSLTISVGTNGA
jgi:hypothetical protein